MAAKKTVPPHENSQAPVVVTKVSAYPIPVHFGAPGPGQLHGEILKVTEIGFLMRAQKHYFKAGEKMEAQFELPTLGISVKQTVTVIKTYDAMDLQEGHEKQKHLVVEMHFKALGDAERKGIRQFITRIKQKK